MIKSSPFFFVLSTAAWMMFACAAFYFAAVAES
jgi:hypothetical protein